MRPASPEIAAAKLGKLTELRPRLGLVLGTGFDGVQAQLDIDRRVSYEDIPGLPQVGVTGHRGELVIGRLAGQPLLVLAGRAHYYEGHTFATVTFGVRMLASLGVRDLLLTNAAGGINPRLRAGDFMLLTDHINLMGANPLRGEAIPDQPRFVDLSDTYDARLRKLLQRAAKEGSVRLKPGVYIAVSGPTYETPAEIRAFRRLGADAVGMSTVPEAIVARQCGLRVAAVSCITNPAAGLGAGPLSHAEVLDNAAGAQTRARELLRRFAALYRQSEDHGQSHSGD